MAKILRFDEPSEFTPLTYRGLDTLPVYIVEEGGTSYDYFGFTEIPDELNAGRNLLALTGTKNLVPGSEIAIEVLNANGELIPVKTFDHIGFGNRRVFAIEVNEKVPEGDAVITVVGTAKGKVGFNSEGGRDNSQPMPRNYSGRFNIRWQKRLNCYPRKRNTSDVVFFPNPDITIEEIKRPYWKLDYNSRLTSSYTNLEHNQAAEFTLVSDSSISDTGFQNTSASLRYEVEGNKYFIFANDEPDFGGFTDDMIGGTILFPNPVGVYPKSTNGPYAPPVYNELEDGDGTGVLDTGSLSAQYSNQGAYSTYIIERLSPLQLRVNSPHTTMQGQGRNNQKEIFHRTFAPSDFRLDWGQDPILKTDSLMSASSNPDDKFYTSYAYIQFNNLTPIAGDITRIKTYIRNDQTTNDFHLVGDNPVFSPELLVQSQSLRTRFPAGDFTEFGVSSSLFEYWEGAANTGATINNPELIIYKMSTGNVATPIRESLQVGLLNTATGLQTTSDYWLVKSTVDIEFRENQYYEISFKSYAIKTPPNGPSPEMHVYMHGPAVNSTGDVDGKLIGTINGIENNELVVSEDPLNFNIQGGNKFTFKADATEFARLRFKIISGLWYIADISVKPYDHFGYTPHYFDTIIPTIKGNVGEKDALDFRFEFYNDDHRKAAYTSEIKNVEFDNEFTFTATSVFFNSASIDTFFGNTPIGDNDWVKTHYSSALLAHEMPELSESIYHIGNVGIGEFSASFVNYPLQIKKGPAEGNATIRLDSYSSSILHLAADIGGTAPTSKSAQILFDHNNAATSSIIGYTDIADTDPGGATMDGASKGGFTIHERHGRIMNLGVGGYSRFHLVTGKSSDYRNAGSHATFIGYRNPKPGDFEYELHISGSEIINSGSIYLPDAPIDNSATYAAVIHSTKGRVGKRLLSDLTGDDDWHIAATYITQSRIGSHGKTIWIGDGLVTTGLTPTSYIFQISQSTSSPKVRLEGIPYAASMSNNVLIVESSTGKLYTTGSYGVGSGGGGGGGDDGDWHKSGSSSPPTSINDSIWTSGSVELGWINGNPSQSQYTPTYKSIYKPALHVRGRIEQTFNGGSDQEKATIIGLYAGMSYSMYSHTGDPKGYDGSTQNHWGGGIGNTYIGYAVGRNRELNDDSGCSENTAVGNEAFMGATNLGMDGGNYNTYIGSKAGKDALDGNDNTGVGSQAMHNVSTGEDNVVLGSQAAKGLLTGDKNTMLGYNTGDEITSGDGNIFIGASAGDGTGNVSNTFAISSNAGTQLNSPICGTGMNTSAALIRINDALGIGKVPAYALDVLTRADGADPVRVDKFTEDGGRQMVWDPTSKLIHVTQTVINKNGQQQAFVNTQNSPSVQIISGSVMLIRSGAVSQSNGFYANDPTIYLGKLEVDSRDETSFYLTGSSQSGSVYLSGSGRIGFGTDDPQSEMDFRADEVRFTQRGSLAGVKINTEGNFESFLSDTQGGTTGSEYILKFNRGGSSIITGDFLAAKLGIEVPDDAGEYFNGLREGLKTELLMKAEDDGLMQIAEPGDIIGSIRYTVDSGSTLDSRGAGEAATIKTIVNTAGTSGVTAKLVLSVAKSEGSAAEEVITANVGGMNVVGHITASGNISTLGNISSSGTIYGADLRANSLKTPAGQTLIRYHGGSETVRLGVNANNSNPLQLQGHITASGNISASGYIYTGGDIHTTGDVVASSTTPSDYRLKKNIGDISNPLKTIRDLVGKSFDWKNTDESDYGLIAQEVEKILPELVKEKNILGKDKQYKVVKYMSMIPILIESIKELDNNNNLLEEKLNKLIFEVNNLKNN